MSLRNLSDDVDFSTDSEDDDYVPSAEDSDDHVVHSDEDVNDLEDGNKSKVSKKRKLKKEQLPRKRKGGIKLEDEVSEEDEDEEEEAEEDENHSENSTEIKDKHADAKEDKGRVDALWADFLKDTKSNLKPSKQNDKTQPSESTAKDSKINNGETNPEKVTVTKIYQFAGEEVRVKEQVAVTESSAKIVATESDSENTSTAKTDVNKKPNSGQNFPLKKTAGGLGSIVGKISSKTPKLSTLEKSRLDWNNFKSDEGIEEELSIFNKGKDGYLEKQAFLQRSDLRQFEIERSLRQNKRSKR